MVPLQPTSNSGALTSRPPDDDLVLGNETDQPCDLKVTPEDLPSPVLVSPQHSLLDTVPTLQPPPDFNVEALSDEDDDSHLTVSL